MNLFIRPRALFRQTVDSSTFNTGAAVTDTLTAAQESGTLFEIDGTDDIVVNMPALTHCKRRNNI